MITIAVLLCQRKLTDWKISLPAVFSQTYSDYTVYLNIQIDAGKENEWEELYDFLSKQTIKYHIDEWTLESTWNPIPTIQNEQDNRGRIFPICTARNMALMYAKYNYSSHILFVDADVTIPKNSIERLLGANKSIIGGIVYGRGKGTGQKYITGEHNYKQHNNPRGIKEVDYSTCGFLLIQREVFRKISFSFDPETCLVDDPLFAKQAREAGYPWYVDIYFSAQHHSNNQA